jgi:dTMP kinase
MRKNTYKGILIAFDGPNGAGKTTLMGLVGKQLKSIGYEVYATKEPTETELGHYLKTFSETHTGYSLTCLVMADRYEHLDKEIIPALKEGKVVITDRYILSSLILQMMDGVDSDFIMHINSEIIMPDLQVAVYANKTVLQERLNNRTQLARFEKNNQSERELFFMKKGVETLKEHNITIQEIDNSNELNENVGQIVLNIEKLLKV